MKNRFYIITHLVLTVLLFVLAWEYPVASFLRSVFIIYEMICLILWLYEKKRDSAEALPETTCGKASAAIPSHSLKKPERAVVLFLVLGALLPFFWQPGVSDATVEAVENTDFYSDTDSGERVQILMNIHCSGRHAGTGSQLRKNGTAPYCESVLLDPFPYVGNRLLAIAILFPPPKEI